ncbi:SRPBCC family protein [Gordonia effusa]|nr:SRPBCC family protein [Gordonia effusa]
MRSRHLSVVIAASPESVYDYAADPDNLRHWAAGLASSEVTRRGDALLVESPMGTVIVRFVPHNDLGVFDHDVTLPTGETVHNPVRVLPHPDGAEVVFTVRQRDMSDEEFERDCATVTADLNRLRQILVDSAE